MSGYDFSTAEKSIFDLIPARTIVPVTCVIQAGDAGTPETAFKVTKNGDLYQMVLELTVTEGDYAKRKIWHRLTMGAPPGHELSEGQKKAVQISASWLRAAIEAARGFSPTDESEKAVAARKINSLHELDGMEFWIEVGIEKSEGYDDKNSVKKIMPYKEGQTIATAAAQSTLPMGGSSPAQPAGSVGKPSWAS